MTRSSDVPPIRVKAVGAITPQNEALYEVGKKMLSDSIEVGREFSKFMISVSSGAIPIYLGLIGIANQKVFSQYIYVIPPSTFLLATVLFVLSYFPRHGRYSLDVIEEIEAARNRGITGRNVFLYPGLAVFLLGIALSIGCAARVFNRQRTPQSRIQTLTMFVPAKASPAEAISFMQSYVDKINQIPSRRAASFHDIRLDSGLIVIADVEVDQ